MQVAGISRNPRSLETLAAELGDAFLPVTADVADAEAAFAARHETLADGASLLETEVDHYV